MSNPQWFTYHFEAVSIQEYIFAGAKLKDMVAASELVDKLCREPLDEAVKALGLTKVSSLPKTDEQIAFPRAAGGAFIAVLKSQKHAQRFAAMWTLFMAEFAPSLKFTASLGEGESLVNTVKNGIKKQQSKRNLTANSLPAATPLMERSPRTGDWVVAYDQHAAGGAETLDRPSFTKREFAKENAKLKNKQNNEHVDIKGLDTKFLGSNNQDNFVFPVCMEHQDLDGCKKQIPFPFSDKGTAEDGEHYIGMIHADGNGLGQFLHSFFEVLKNQNDEDYYAAYNTFTTGLEAATEKAGQVATEKVLIPHKQTLSGQDKPILPMRPIILGGDDLSVICRADLAFDFCQVFIETFESETQTLMTKINQMVKMKDPMDKLTACAGIAFVKSNQPFYMAAHLAENLCGQAKKVSREARAEHSANKGLIASSLAFHHVTNSLFEDASTAVEQELTAKHENNTYLLTLKAYQLVGQPQPGLVAWSDFKALAGGFGESDEKLGIATLRNLATWLHADIDRAKELYERWQQVSESTEHGKQAWAKWQNNLRKLGVESGQLFLKHKNKDGTEIHSNPFSDLLAYHSMVKEQQTLGAQA